MRVPSGGVVQTTGGAAAAEMSIPDLERQYEREMERRRSGRKKVIWGVVLAAAAYAALEYIPPLSVPDPADYDSDEDYQSAVDRRSAAETGRSVVTGLSAALGAWGAFQWGYGWRNTRNLGLNLRQASAPSIDERYVQAQEPALFMTRVKLSLGRDCGRAQGEQGKTSARAGRIGDFRRWRRGAQGDFGRSERALARAGRTGESERPSRPERRRALVRR